VTVAQGAVIATRPANTPFRVMPPSGFLKIAHAVMSAVMAPAAAARFVVTAIRAMSGVPAVVLPGLNPNQPNHRMKTPRAAIGMLWPGIALTFPSLEYRPSRGPSITAPQRAAHPPMEWTTVEPAKSMNPSFSSHPFPWYRPPHAQDPKTG
jgi:hypothetical protein